MAKKTCVQFIARAIRLYEQEPGEAEASARLGLYVRRWVRWAGAGLTSKVAKPSSCTCEVILMENIRQLQTRLTSP